MTLFWPGRHLFDAELGARDLPDGEAPLPTDEVSWRRLFSRPTLDLGRAVAALPADAPLLVDAAGRAERRVQPVVPQLPGQSVDRQPSQIGNYQRSPRVWCPDDFSPRRHFKVPFFIFLLQLLGLVFAKYFHSE